MPQVWIKCKTYHQTNILKIYVVSLLICAKICPCNHFGITNLRWQHQRPFWFISEPFLITSLPPSNHSILPTNPKLLIVGRHKPSIRKEKVNIFEWNSENLFFFVTFTLCIVNLQYNTIIICVVKRPCISSIWETISVQNCWYFVRIIDVSNPCQNFVNFIRGLFHTMWKS